MKFLFGKNERKCKFLKGGSKLLLMTVFCFVVGGTNTGAAIDQTARIGFSETNGARPRSQGVPRVLVVLTDGRSGDNVEGASQNVSLNCEQK